MQTKSRIMVSPAREPERAMLLQWCHRAANNGGSFEINQEWFANDWWITYTINWPDGVIAPTQAQDAAADSPSPT